MCLFFSPTISSGAFEKLETGAASIAMGNALVAVKSNSHAIYYNPASISISGKMQVAFTYQNFYEIGELNQADITTNFLLGDHAFSVAINRYGIPDYQEFQFTIGSHYNIAEDFVIGASTQYYILSIAEYGRGQTWGINISFFYQFLPRLSIGAMFTNLNQPEISKANEKLPQTMNLGFCYYPMEYLTISFELYRDIRFSPEYRAGFSYDITSSFGIRAGIENNIETFSLGFGLKTEWACSDYAVKVHPALGVSHILTLQINL
jgi:hypothetical protein